MKFLAYYPKSSISSRPCIILDPKIPRIVLEVFEKAYLLEQKNTGLTQDPFRTPEMSKKYDFDDTKGHYQPIQSDF